MWASYLEWGKTLVPGSRSLQHFPAHNVSLYCDSQRWNYCKIITIWWRCVAVKLWLPALSQFCCCRGNIYFDTFALCVLQTDTGTSYCSKRDLACVFPSDTNVHCFCSTLESTEDSSWIWCCDTWHKGKCSVRLVPGPKSVVFTDGFVFVIEQWKMLMGTMKETETINSTHTPKNCRASPQSGTLYPM